MTTKRKGQDPVEGVSDKTHPTGINSIGELIDRDFYLGTLKKYEEEK